MKEMLTIKEASRLLGVSPSTLRRWDREGRLKPVRVGKHRRYPYRALMELIEQKKENAVAIYAREIAERESYLKDLEKRIEYLKRAVQKQEKDAKIYVIKDIGSGVSENREGLLKLIELASLGKIKKIYVTLPNQLVSYGYTYLIEFFKVLGVQVVSVLQDKV